MKLHSPAAERNADAIGRALEGLVLPGHHVIEVGSGSGQHAVAFGARFPEVTWQPTEPDPERRASIAAWIEHAGTANVLAPVALDVLAGPWPAPPAGARGWDAVFSANVIHIAPWEVTLGLMEGAAAALVVEGSLLLYGPFLRGSGELGEIVVLGRLGRLGPEADAVEAALDAPSNRRFDQSLRGSDPSWGVRELGAVVVAAKAVGLGIESLLALPANNLLLVFRRADQRL